MIVEKITRIRCRHCGWSIDRKDPVEVPEVCPACGVDRGRPRAWVQDYKSPAAPVIPLKERKLH